MKGTVIYSVQDMGDLRSPNTLSFCNNNALSDPSQRITCYNACGCPILVPPS